MDKHLVIKVRTPGGFIQADVLEAAWGLPLKNQKKLYKVLGKGIDPQQCQQAMDALADLILDSRARRDRRSIPINALRYFVDAVPKEVLNSCEIPKLYFVKE